MYIGMRSTKAWVLVEVYRLGAATIDQIMDQCIREHDKGIAAIAVIELQRAGLLTIKAETDDEEQPQIYITPGPKPATPANIRLD